MKSAKIASNTLKPLLGTLLVLGALHTGLFAQANAPEQIARQIAADLAGAERGTTPATWLQKHPSEKLQLYNGRQLANDTEQWCARTVVRHAEPSGRVWTRAVYFYEPQAPADDALPPSGTSLQKLVETTCQLGLVWVDVPETDSSAGINLVQAVEQVLTARYGAPQSPPFPGGFGSGGWTKVRQWQVKGGGVLTVAYDRFGGKGHRALVRMAFPNSDAMHDLAAETEKSRVEQRTQLDEVIRRIEQAGMPATMTAEMEALLTKPDFFAAKNLPQGTRIVAAFRDWVTAAKSRPAAGQAMALLVADYVLSFLDNNGVRMGDAVRAEMGRLGAQYVHDQLAGGPVYTHGLLLKAKAIAPPGGAADTVLLAEMERGFDNTGMCAAGSEEFALVIKEGESLLAGARLLPPQTLAALHFMVADAYTTIVWLATTTDAGYHDPKQYEPQAGAARQKALGHYRAALALEHGTARSHAAWRQAWRLAAGLVPTSGRYFCVYD